MSESTRRRKNGAAPAADPAIEASRRVGRLLDGGLLPEDRKVFKAEVDAVCAFCPTCYAYQLPTHRCWTPEVVAELRAAWAAAQEARP
jgi:hypothetical protein